MTIPSPCTKVCTIDDRAGLCRGCGRSLEEIAQWSTMGRERRDHIMAELPGRLADTFDVPKQGSEKAAIAGSRHA